MTDSIKFCVVCGRIIPALSTRRTTCSNRCGISKKNGYAPYADYKEPPLGRLHNLTAVQQLAHAQGLTYGKYVALDYERRRKDGLV